VNLTDGLSMQERRPREERTKDLQSIDARICPGCGGKLGEPSEFGFSYCPEGDGWKAADCADLRRVAWVPAEGRGPSAGSGNA
jgi:hypothetical protein